MLFLCYTELNMGWWKEMSKENVAVFIRHNECYGVTKWQAEEAIIPLTEQGVTDFLSGGQGGFDCHREYQ